MKEAKQSSNSDRPVTYRIKIQGNLDQSWSDWFNGMTITLDNDDASITTLTGLVADQSALRGILTRVWDLNLAVISVNQTKNES